LLAQVMIHVLYVLFLAGKGKRRARLLCVKKWWIGEQKWVDGAGNDRLVREVTSFGNV